MADEVEVARVFEEAARHQLIAPNPEAALWRAILEHGYVPLGNEYRDGEWVCQVAANRAADKRVFRWKSGMVTAAPFPPLSAPPAPAAPDRVLPLSHLSQIDLFPDANLNPGDCGPACFGMWAQSRGKHFTVDEFASALARATGRPMPYEGTTLADLEALARWYALPVRRAYDLTPARVREEIEAERPVIALVHAGSLPRPYPYSGGHYVLIVGMIGEGVVFHDPNCPRNGSGTYARLPASTFWQAWRDAVQDGNRPCSGLILG